MHIINITVRGLAPDFRKVKRMKTLFYTPEKYPAGWEVV